MDSDPPQPPSAPAAQLLEQPQVYQQLRRLARSFMARERAGHTMQATDLVHGAYLRLFEQQQDFGDNHSHFMAIAATMMRRVLVNHAHSHNADKRGAGAVNLTLSAAEHVAQPTTVGGIDVLALDRALDKLKQIDPRMVAIIELRYFAELTIEATAAALGISPATVKREWGTAKLWLLQELSGDGAAKDSPPWK